MSDAIPLPPRPNLQHYKTVAKALQRVCQSGEADAIERWAARWFKAPGREEVKRIEQRWRKFRESKEGCRLADAQWFLAREHGFANWAKFARHVRMAARAGSGVSNFEAAADAIVNGNLATLEKLLREHPGLIRERSTREHRSTLLHYVSANGVEDFRQKTPKNIVAITKLLLDTGADVNAESEAYGGGSTTVGLAATSLHPQQAGVQIDLLQTLLDRGARIDTAPAGNGQFLIAGCLANGQPEAAEFFAKLGVPMDLVGSAGLGRVEVVKRILEEDGAGRRRVDRQQIESAFESACWYGQTEAVDLLLGAGVDPGWQNKDGQTGLHCAAYGPYVALIGELVRCGCPVNGKDKNYQATPLDVALWVWGRATEPEKRERCYEAVAVLARAGAELDPEQWRGWEGEGSGMLEKIAGDARMQRALRGE
jgi:ankyrin repeat protein